MITVRRAVVAGALALPLALGASGTAFAAGGSNAEDDSIARSYSVTSPTDNEPGPFSPVTGEVADRDEEEGAGDYPGLTMTAESTPEGILEETPISEIPVDDIFGIGIDLGGDGLTDDSEYGSAGDVPGVISSINNQIISINDDSFDYDDFGQVGIQSENDISVVDTLQDMLPYCELCDQE